MTIDELIEDLKKFRNSNENCEIFVEIETKEQCFAIQHIELGSYYGKDCLTIIIE